MNPPPTPAADPILYSLPLGAAALVLAILVGGGALLALLLTRHRERRAQFAARVRGVEDAPWLASLLEGIPHAALVAGSNGRPLAWNAAAARSLSRLGKESGLPLSLTTLVTRVLHTGATETTDIASPEAPGRRLRVTASLLGAAEHPCGALMLLHEPIEAAKSVESYRRLITTLAHELRTPLTAILGHADILGSCRPEEEGLWRRSRDFIASEADRLARLVEDLLLLSRLDLTPLQRQPVNLRAVAEEAVSALFQVAESRGVRLALQSPSSIPRVLGDRDRLSQVFLNLLDNAVKYSSDGGEATVSLAPEGDHVQVAVRDDGAGIASEDLPHIFEPLYRSENVRHTPGTGLGLTVVRTILEQHGATVDVQSAPGRGTTFRFRLPCAQGKQVSESPLS